MVNSIQQKVLDEHHLIAILNLSVITNKITTQLRGGKIIIDTLHWSVVANDLKYGNEIKNRNDEFLFYRNTRLSTVENPELSFASKYRYPALVRSGF